MHMIFLKLLSFPYYNKKDDYIKAVEEMKSLYGSFFRDDIYEGYMKMNKYFPCFKSIILAAKKTYLAIDETAEEGESSLNSNRIDVLYIYDAYIKNIRQLCFNYSTLHKKYIPKWRIFNIVQFIPEFFHYLKFKIVHLSNQKEKNDELHYELEEEYNDIQKLLNNMPLFTEIVDSDMQFFDFSEKKFPLYNFRKKILSYLSKYHEGSTSYLIYYVFFQYSYENQFLLQNREHNYILLSICFTLECSDFDDVFKRCIQYNQCHIKDIISRYVFQTLLGSRNSSIISMHMSKIHGDIELEMLKVLKTSRIEILFKTHCLLVSYDQSPEIQVSITYLSRLNWIKFMYTQYRLYVIYV